MNFITIPEGTYRIGTPLEGVQKCVKEWKGRLINPCYSEEAFFDWISKEYPSHKVKIESFDLMQTLVSHADILQFLSQTNSPVPESLVLSKESTLPVWGVSLDWANAFCSWLSKNDAGFNYRLPTEVEWEVAARGDDFREYPYGHEFNASLANTIESGIGTTTPVEKYSHSPGPFGHFDLAGNVEEWVSTEYYVYPGGRLIEDDLYQRFGSHYAILRGGSFACGGDLSRGARRHGPFPDPLFRYTGFRLVRMAKSGA